MNTEQILRELQSLPGYSGQIVFAKEVPPRPARYSKKKPPGSEDLLGNLGIDRLYSHQAEAVESFANGRNTVVATSTASGKSLCYFLPIVESLTKDPDARSLLLYPTKALCQDQFKAFKHVLKCAQLERHLTGVLDGDTPASLRRRLRDHASVVFTNPDMLHASVMPQHGRWAEFLKKLQILVLDELHVYSGIFGSNMALVMRRLNRICRHYGSDPRIVACSGTIANPGELAQRLSNQDFTVISKDGSPAQKKTYVFWNPPQVRTRDRRSRRSANVEAHEIMAFLIEKGIATIAFSKAKVTAEMIYRYVCDRLRKCAPQLVSKVTPYRAGYVAEDRRAIEARLFRGELIGVSTTPALELGIDVGVLEACIVVGYPGTRVSFFQQAGRAGRREQESLVFLIGLDTSINQFILTHPEYIFDQSVENALIDPENPFVLANHLRCAAFELPLNPGELSLFGPWAPTALKVLEENGKIKFVDGKWYSTTTETPHYDLSLRASDDGNVLIEDADTGQVIGEVTRLDAEPLLHPQAIHLQFGETYRVLSLDLERNLARVKREETDYYTQPWGGTDVHHIDQRLRGKPFGAGHAFWGEVTAHFGTFAFEKIHFYSLDPISIHGLDLPTMALETMALWLVPPDDVMEKVRASGLDAHSGLRGIGYATRMLLPLFITCDTLDFSHSVGSVNSPWNAVFIYERYTHGLGFTEKAYDLLCAILPKVLDNIRNCPCEQGCPCCVGKPLRQSNVWNVERGEGSIPSKAAAIMILDGLLGDGSNLDCSDEASLSDSSEGRQARIEGLLRRRLERGREPRVFHSITPEPEVKTSIPAPESVPQSAAKGLRMIPGVARGSPRVSPNLSDVAARLERRKSFDRDLHKKIAKKLPLGGLAPNTPKPAPPAGMATRRPNLPPTAFPGKPPRDRRAVQDPNSQPQTFTKSIPNSAACSQSTQQLNDSTPQHTSPIQAGDPIASRARKLRKNIHISGDNTRTSPN